MDDNGNSGWLTGAARFKMTCLCEHGLRAASGILWQRLGLLASGNASELGADYFSPSRRVIAEYLRHTGRVEEANEVEAIGCNEKPPHTGFGGLTAAQRDALRESLGNSGG
jgi:hypothetical protein